MAKPFAFFGRSSSLLLLIFYKILLALVETLAGILCLLTAFFAKHAALAIAIDQVADKGRLDQFVGWIVHKLIELDANYELITHVGMVLIALGVFKVFVAIGLWFKSHKMRMIAMLIFGGLSIYSTYKLFLTFSVIKLIALLFDLFIVYYFWRILPKHLED